MDLMTVSILVIFTLALTDRSFRSQEKYFCFLQVKLSEAEVCVEHVLFFFDLFVSICIEFFFF